MRCIVQFNDIFDWIVSKDIPVCFVFWSMCVFDVDMLFWNINLFIHLYAKKIHGGNRYSTMCVCVCAEEYLSAGIIICLILILFLSCGCLWWWFNGIAFSFLEKQVKMECAWPCIGLVVYACDAVGCVCACLLFSRRWIINVFTSSLVCVGWPM